MTFTLELVEWGKSALDLINHTKELDPNVPAVLHIRHSERPQMELQKHAFKMALSERGEKASIEFGVQLPVNRNYSFYHTDIDRTQMTAKKIQQGIQYNGGASEIVGEIPLFSFLDYEEAGKILREMKIEDDELRARTVFYRWLSGIYPPWIIKPSLDFSQFGASLMMKNLREAECDDFHVWVSHENWVAAFLMHWLGEWSFEWIPFLDGFILQFYDDHIVSFFRGKKKKLNYPYWWNFPK